MDPLPPRDRKRRTAPTAEPSSVSAVAAGPEGGAEAKRALVEPTVEPTLDDDVGPAVSPDGDAFFARAREEARAAAEAMAATGGGAGEGAEEAKGGEEDEEDGGENEGDDGPVFQYEYLDHTADVQIHAWGGSMEEALAQTALGMFGYMTDPAAVSIDEDCTMEIEATGHDWLSLLFNFLDEGLFTFGTEDLIAKEVEVLELRGPVPTHRLTAGDGAYLESREAKEDKPDRDAEAAEAAEKAGAAFFVRARLRGEKFDLKKHPQGTEVKAITYSNMMIIPPVERKEGGGGGGGGGGGVPVSEDAKTIADPHDATGYRPEEDGYGDWFHVYVIIDI